MNINIKNPVGRSSLSLSIKDQREHTQSLSLHSNYTVLKRMIHIVCVVSIFYGIGFATFQFNALEDLSAIQHSAFGTYKNGYNTAKQHVSFFAEFWSSSSFQDPVEQDALIDLWLSLDSVRFVGVYSETGYLIHGAPDGSSLKQILSQTPDSLSVTSAFKNDHNAGQIIMVIDNSAIQILQKQRSRLLYKGLLACVLIAGIGGAYLFRGFRYVRPKTRS